MTKVTVKTDELVAGATLVQKYYDDIDSSSNQILNISVGQCSSLASFKNALSIEKENFSNHTKIFVSKLIECAYKLEEIDVTIGSSATEQLSSVSNLSFSEPNATLNLLSNRTFTIGGTGYYKSQAFSQELHKYLKFMTWSNDNPYNLIGIGGRSLFDVSNITPEQVKETLAKIKSQPGRDAVAKTAIFMIGSAADAGYKLNYRHAGTGADPHVPTIALTNGGVDCNAYASWLVDKGVPGGLYWRPVESFMNIGTELDDYSKAQCGDVFVTYTNEHSKHVGVIMENHPEEGYFITSESSMGIGFQIRTYAELKNYPGTAKVMDLTDIYNGKIDPNADRYAAWEGKDLSKYSDSW